MNVALFALYYIKLRLFVLLDFHRTLNPVTIKWRWNDWNYKYKSRRR